MSVILIFAPMQPTILDTFLNLNLHEKSIKFVDHIVNWALTDGLQIIVIILVAWLIKIIAKRFIQRIVRVAVKSDRLQLGDAETKRMNTLVRVFNWVINTIIVVITFIMVIQKMGVNVTPILASAGIAGVAIGFGAQYLVRDVLTGFFIIFENQYRIGDVVNIEGTGGLVEDISLRVTTLRDMDGTVHYIPHGEIKKVANLSIKFSRINLNIGVAYDTDLDFAIKVINRVGEEMKAESIWKDDLNTAPKFLRVDSFNDSTISLKIVAETKPLRQWDLAGELRKRIKEAFQLEGIDIPFPQRVIHYAKNNNSIND